MKPFLRKLFSPLLKIFESGTSEYVYKPSHRLVLIVMGGLFAALAALVVFVAEDNGAEYFLPIVLFGGLGIVSLIIGFLGTDRAVAKIWGSA